VFLLDSKSYLQMLSHSLIIETKSVGLQNSLILQKDGQPVEYAAILCAYFAKGWATSRICRYPVCLYNQSPLWTGQTGLVGLPPRSTDLNRCDN